MSTRENVGSGLDQPRKPGLEQQPGQEQAGAEKNGQDADSAKARRIEQERNAFDLNHKPTERDAQIDGSGARFEVDG